MSRASDLAERLMGTCDDGGAEQEALDLSELTEFDGIVFRCNGCGWWCEVGEANEGPNGEDVCDDCHEGDEDDG